MAKVEIPDELLDALRALVKARHLSNEPPALLVQSARRHLVDVCAPGFDRDPLTGTMTRERLREHISRATEGSSEDDKSIFSERFLCVDVDKFKKYLEVRGSSAGDFVLRRLAYELQTHYGGDAVCRFGGDEFVVVLGNREPWLPSAPPEVTLKHSVVYVATRRNRRRSQHLNKWIEMHLDGGILSARPEGTHVACGEPSWLDRP